MTQDAQFLYKPRVPFKVIVAVAALLLSPTGLSAPAAVETLFRPLISQKALQTNPLNFDESARMTTSRLVRELNNRRDSLPVGDFYTRIRQKNMEVTLGPHTSGRWITINETPVYSLHIGDAGSEGLSVIVIPTKELNSLPSPARMEADADAGVTRSHHAEHGHLPPDPSLAYREENVTKNGTFEDPTSKNSTRLRHLVAESLITYKNKNNTYGQPTLVLFCGETSDNALGSIEDCLEEKNYVYIPKAPRFSKEAAQIWIHGTLEKPTKDTFRFGLINGSIQAAISYLITAHAHSIDPSVSMDYIPMAWSFVFGTTIGTFIDSYVNWVYRGGHMARFAKNYAISLLFSSTLTGLRNDWAFLASMGAFASTMSHLVQNAFGNNLLKTEVNNFSRQHLISRLLPGKWKGVSIAKLEKEVFYYYPFSVRLFEMLGPRVNGVPIGTVGLWTLIPVTQYMLVKHGEMLIEIADNNPVFRARIDYSALKADVEATRQRWEATKHLRPKVVDDLLAKHKMNQNLSGPEEFFALSQIQALEAMATAEERVKALPDNLDELLNYFEIQYEGESQQEYLEKSTPSFIKNPSNSTLSAHEKTYLKDSWQDLRGAVLEALNDFSEKNNGLPLDDELLKAKPVLKAALADRLKLERLLFEVLKEKASGTERFLADPESSETKATQMQAQTILKEGLSRLYSHIQLEETQTVPQLDAPAANKEFEKHLPQWNYLLKNAAKNAKVHKPHAQLLEDLLRDTATPSGLLPDYLKGFDRVEVEAGYAARKEKEALQIKRLWDVLYLRVRSKTNAENAPKDSATLAKVLKDELTAYANLVDAMLGFTDRWDHEQGISQNGLWASVRPNACQNFMIDTLAHRKALAN